MVACGCMWCMRVHAGACGCMWVHAVHASACGRMRVHVGACEGMWVHVRACECMRVHAGACGCTWVHQNYMFVHADQTVSLDSPYFWNEAFALQHTASGQLACPTFLQPLAQGILSTGKSLLLLRAHQDHHRRSACRACFHCGVCFT